MRKQINPSDELLTIEQMIDEESFGAPRMHASTLTMSSWQGVSDNDSEFSDLEVLFALTLRHLPTIDA